jgi:hypothetical protein
MDSDTIEIEEEQQRELTGHDRCDKCIAQAYFLAVFEVGELTFCRHHYMEIRELLEGSARYIIDASGQLDS